MMLSLRNACLDLGGPAILGDVNFQLVNNQRVALLGRNGCGKSTLLKVLAGQMALDSGVREINQDATIGYLGQDVPAGLRCSVYEFVAKSFGRAGQLLLQSQAGKLDPDALHSADLEPDIWSIANRIDKALSQLQLDADAEFASLSGGRQRRALLAGVIAMDPDILLLDEPTNHLDVDSVLWLESYLVGRKGVILFVSHDRQFISSLATRVVELDRGQLHQYDVGYHDYLRLRDRREEEEQRHSALFDKKLAQEERWIRQGVQARRTRNEGRVRALKALRNERQARREKQSGATLKLDRGEQSGRLVAEIEQISFHYGDRTIVEDFSMTVLRGDKIGLIGPNGAGKTTLLRLMLGELQPDAGGVKLGTRLSVAYLDQQRSEIDENKSLIDNVSLGREFIEIDGQAQHIIGYLQQFLFSPEQARARAGLLSGGERARLLLARLFSRPANVLVLDEPTNDLDIESLELLEELLLGYKGTLFLVSHDRALLNNVVTSSLVFEGDGKVGDYVGGYDDWLRLSRTLGARQQHEGVTSGKKKTTLNVGVKTVDKPRPAKLSYKDQRELDALPEAITQLEAEQESLYASLSNPDLHTKAPDKVREAKRQLEDIESKLINAYQRWEQLEALRH